MTQTFSKENNVQVLKDLLKEEEKWIKVHAAEFLLWEGLENQVVYEEFKDQEIKYKDVFQYRIGIWRVLFQASKDSIEKQSYIQKIQKAFEMGPDKLHALESLAKLKTPISTDYLNFRSKIFQTKEINSYYLYGLWNLYYFLESEKEIILEKLFKILNNPNTDPQNKIIISYIFRYIEVSEPFKNKLFAIDYSLWPKNSQLQFVATLLMLDSENHNFDILMNGMMKLDECEGYLSTAILAISTHSNKVGKSYIDFLYNKLIDQSSSNFNADNKATAAYSILKFLHNYK